MHPSPFSLARAFYEDLDAAGVKLTDKQYDIFKAAFRRKIAESKASSEQHHPAFVALDSRWLIRRRLLKEARSKPIGSEDRIYRLRAAFTYGQALRGVPAKDWKFG